MNQIDNCLDLIFCCTNKHSTTFRTNKNNKASHVLDDTLLGCKHNKVDNSWSLHKFKQNCLKLYTNFEFCQHKLLSFVDIFKTYNLQSQAIYVDKHYLNKSLHILESDDIEQVIAQILFKIW